MTALPYVEQVTEDFSRIAWSFRAEAMRGPRSAAGVSTTAAQVEAEADKSKAGQASKAVA
jgi:hypothetical protein